jgi:UDPglucose 6-dehydrogenase
MGSDTHLWDAIQRVNQETFEDVTAKLRHLLKALVGKTIGILGLTYKPGTSTMRRSPSITLMRNFAAEKASCRAFDPMASTDESAEYADLFSRANDVEELVRGADALVLVTEWPEFRELDFSKVAASMRQAIIVDTKNYLDPNALAEAGFIYEGFGRRAAPPGRLVSSS